MTITVQVPPQIEATLLSRARAQGMTVDAYVQSLIAGAATEPQSPPMSLDEFEAALDELSEGSENWPVLPPDAYTREGIYGNG